MQAKPGGEMSCAANMLMSPTVAAIKDAVIEPMTGDRGQATRCLIAARVSNDLGFECHNAFGQRFALIE